MGTDLGILVRLLEVIPHLGEKLLGFILTCNILKGYLIIAISFIFSGIGFSEASEHSAASHGTHTGGHLSGKPVSKCHENKDREYPA